MLSIDNAKGLKPPRLDFFIEGASGGGRVSRTTIYKQLGNQVELELIFEEKNREVLSKIIMEHLFQSRTGCVHD